MSPLALVGLGAVAFLGVLLASVALHPLTGLAAQIASSR